MHPDCQPDHDEDGSVIHEPRKQAPIVDRELAVLDQCFRALKTLTLPEQSRVARWLFDRIESDK
jgi:hypothetical protein